MDRMDHIATAVDSPSAGATGGRYVGPQDTVIGVNGDFF